MLRISGAGQLGLAAWVPDVWAPNAWVPDVWVPGRLGSAKFWSRTGVLKNKVVMRS